MAKLTNPLMSQDARGSVSGVQFSANTSGSFASRKSTGTRAQRGESTNWRGQIKTAHTAWLALSAELQAQWAEVATPTQTARNAFIGAYLRNLMIAHPVFTKSPLQTPIADVFSNLKARNFPGSPPWISVSYSMRAPQDDALIGYWAIPAGTSLPHVRKFTFSTHSHGFDGGFNAVIPYLPPITALRLLHWDHTNGRIIREYRALLLGTAFTIFEPP